MNLKNLPFNLKMENFNGDELFMICRELDMPSLLEFCASNSRFNNLMSSVLNNNSGF